jgi:hypothetical protein
LLEKLNAGAGELSLCYEQVPLFSATRRFMDINIPVAV